jgi:hypothetical protein
MEMNRPREAAIREYSVFGGKGLATSDSLPDKSHCILTILISSRPYPY